MKDRDKEILEIERREYRRRRRIRNQISSLVMLIILVAALLIGVLLGISAYRNRKGVEEEAAQQTKVEDLLESEEPLKVEESTEVIPELTPEEKLDEIILAAIEVMPIEDKVAGLFLVRPESITGVSTAIQAADGTRTALEKYAVGGVIYFSKNIRSEQQLKDMIRNTCSFSKYPLFIAVDEEGGRVSRVAEKGLAAGVDSAAKIGQTGDAANAYAAGTAIGSYLSDLGFDLNFAPVADLANVENSIMKERSYGAQASVVMPYVTSMMAGLEEQEVTACVKHFPGLGSTVADTHEGLAVSSRTAEQFRSEEFTVFQSAIDAGVNMIMVGHMAAPSLTGDHTPASMSSEIVTDILREELGFEGVIITDGMEMAAISEYYSSKDAAIMALKAGCDMILLPDDFAAAYEGVLQAVRDGVISEERINDSLRRIYRIKFADQM